MLAFLREAGKERVLVVHNVTASEVEAGPYDLKAAPWSRCWVRRRCRERRWTVRLPAGASGVWRVKQ